MANENIILTKKIKNPVVILGFPGFGLVGTITTEFLISHLRTEEIGKIWFDHMAPIAAVHESKLIRPISIHHHKESGLVLVHGVTPTAGVEWKIVDLLLKFFEQIEAQEVISIEGIGSMEPVEHPKVYYYSNTKKIADKVKTTIVDSLKDGIIMGVTGALLLKMETRPLLCLFAESHSNLPDSRAASNVIIALDKYIGLKVDPKPLIEQAERFEEKLRKVLDSSQKMTQEQRQKTLSYMG